MKLVQLLEPSDFASDDRELEADYGQMVTRLFAACLIVGLSTLFAAPAFADGVVVHGTSVDAVGSGATVTAKILLLNTGEDEVTLPESVKLDDTCKAKVEDRIIGGLRSSSVTLTFDQSCFGDADSLEADLDAGGPLPAVVIKKPNDTHNWQPLGISAIGALVVAAVVSGIGVAMVKSINTKRNERHAATSDEGIKRRASYVKLKDHVDARVAQLSPPDTLSWKPDLPAPAKYNLSSEVQGLVAGWSFKDSWAANLTLATTAFVALINSADALTAVLGKKPEAALAVMTIAGLISALLIAVANTIAKLVGPSTAKVTTGGLILSTGFVVLGAGLQTGTVGGTTFVLVDGTLAKFVVVALTLLVGAVLLWYALAAMYNTLLAGAPDTPLPTVPPDALATWHVNEDQDWERDVVKDRIRITYADWLTTPMPPTTVSTFPVLWRTAIGDDAEQPARTASLI